MKRSVKTVEAKKETEKSEKQVEEAEEEKKEISGIWNRRIDNE